MSSRVILVTLALPLSLTAWSPVWAQSSLDLGTPAESKIGQSSASTYAIDKIETVNLANGNMSMHIPLVTVGGRGLAGHTLSLSYNSKLWSAEHENVDGDLDPFGQPKRICPGFRICFPE